MTLNDLVFLITKDDVKIISSDRFGNETKTIIMTCYNYQFDKKFLGKYLNLHKKSLKDHHRNQETHL